MFGPETRSTVSSLCIIASILLLLTIFNIRNRPRMCSGVSFESSTDRRVESAADSHYFPLLLIRRYNCPPPVLPLLTPYSEPSRYFDISQGSDIDWTWVAAANESFVKLSKTSGHVLSADSSTWETRVEVSVTDWSLVPSGLHTVTVSLPAQSSFRARRC